MEKPEVKRVCDRCGAKIVIWGNEDRILTNYAEKVWDAPQYNGKANALLRTKEQFQGLVCNNLSENSGCAFRI